jgi:UDP-3-O-[3-hydroxymyristoyl] glucosamine N-acyltransferase
VGLAGSTIVGKNVILAGQVGVAGHLMVGDNVMATGQSGIANSVEENKVISGSPAIENPVWLRSSAIFARLPEWLDTIRELDKRLSTLEITFKALLERTENK